MKNVVDLAEKGDAGAQYILGTVYCGDQVLPRDFTKL